MFKTLVFFIVLYLLPFISFSNSNDIRCRFTSFLLKGDMASWEVMVDSLQKRNLDKAEDDVLLHAEYALTGYLFSQDKKKEAGIIMSKFEAHLENKMIRYPNTANYHAFKAALYGFKIAMAPWKAPFYSFSHQREVEKANQLRKDEALPLIEQANSYYFRPSFFGGDKVKAMLYYEKAFKILSKSPQCNWVFFNNGAWLGQLYTKLGYRDKAIATYHYVLEQNPDFQYIRDELLPQLERGEFIDINEKFEKMLQKEK